LYLVVLTWVRQLQQCFYEITDVHPGKDWNKHALSNINMSPVKSEKKYVVLELSYFKPSEDRKDVVTSIGDGLKDFCCQIFLYKHEVYSCKEAI